MLRLFPQHSAFLFPKKVVVGYVDDYVFSCDFEINKTRGARAFFRLLGYEAPSEFLQFDRLGFDRALHREAVDSNFCEAFDAKVTHLDFDQETDHISTVRLADDRCLPASYVFDSTNHGRLVGTAAGVECSFLGDIQRVAYTHYHPPPATTVPQHGAYPWDYSTSIVRLYSHVDGVDGIAWYIPLGQYVSVGISVSQEHCAVSDDELLGHAVIAFERRGLHFLTRYSEPAPLMGLTHQYFVHQRAFGANWMLAGPAFAQVWWMAGAGVGTSLAAAQPAPRILDDPLRVGRQYQLYMQELIGIHDTFEWFAAADRSSLSAAGISQYSDRFVRTNLRRLARAAGLFGGVRGRVLGRLFFEVFKRESSIKNYCSVISELLPNQTASIFGTTGRAGR